MNDNWFRIEGVCNRKRKIRKVSAACSPHPLINCSFVNYQNTHIVVSGVHTIGSVEEEKVEVYNIKKDSWVVAPKMMIKRSDH